VASHLRPDVLSNRITERRQMLAERMTRAERIVERRIDALKGRVERFGVTLSSVPARLTTQTARMRDHLANLSRHGDTAVRHQLTRARGELAAQDRVLQSLSYKNVLKRGYAVIRDDDDRPVSQAAMLTAGARISIEFSDGRIGAVTTEGGAPPATKKRPPKSGEQAPPPKQGSLF
jgi:exodeoxyribonuclease VII large subunit